MARIHMPKIAHRIYEAVHGTDKSLTPVIYMHALLGSQAHWMNIAERVAGITKRMGYTFDARNHGFSGFSQPYRLQDNLEDLLAFMDYIKAEKAILVGHNMGAITAMSAALFEPSKIERLFVVDMSTARIPPSFVQRLIEFMKERGKELESFPEDVTADDLAGTSYQNTDPEEVSKFAPILIQRFKILTEALRMYDEYPIEYSGQYEGPAHFIYGSHSIFDVEWDTRDIKKHFPTAEMIKFQGATHNLFKEFEDKFVSTLIQRLF